MAKTKLSMPFVLRIGFLRSYKITIVFVGFLYLLSFFLVFPANLVFVWLSRGLIDFCFILLICILGTWAIGRVVAGFDEFFDAFDIKTEPQPKMWWNYSVIKRFDYKPHQQKQRAAVQADVKSLFSSTNKYQKFQNKIRGIIFRHPRDKYRVCVILTAFLLWVGFTLIWLLVFRDNFWAYAGFTVWPWTHLHSIVITLLNIFWFQVFFSALFLIISYFVAIRRLNNSRLDLVVWEHIEKLKESNPFQTSQPARRKGGKNQARKQKKEKNPPFMTYSHFYHVTSKIGHRAAWITLAVIVIVLIQVVRTAFSLEWLMFGTVTWITLAISVIMIPSSLIIFLLPQYELHKLLSDVKYRLLSAWQSIYNEQILKLFQFLQKPPPRNLSKQYETKLLIAEQKLDTLQDIITETRLEKDWTVGIPATIGISTVSVIPTIVTITQNIFPFWP